MAIYDNIVEFVQERGGRATRQEMVEELVNRRKVIASDYQVSAFLTFLMRKGTLVRVERGTYAIVVESHQDMKDIDPPEASAHEVAADGLLMSENERLACIRIKEGARQVSDGEYRIVNPAVKIADMFDSVSDAVDLVAMLTRRGVLRLVMEDVDRVTSEVRYTYRVMTREFNDFLLRTRIMSASELAILRARRRLENNERMLAHLGQKRTALDQSYLRERGRLDEDIQVLSREVRRQRSLLSETSADSNRHMTNVGRAGSRTADV